MAIVERPEGSLFVDGEWTQSKSDTMEPITNPATEATIEQVPVGSAADCEDAITSARAAFDHGPWPRMTGAERGEYLGRLWSVLEAQREPITRLVMAETGAPRPLAEGLHVQTSLDHLQFFAEAARWDPVVALPIDVTPKAGGGKMLGGQVKIYEPFGVVSAITPFNFPLFINLAKIGPALAMGNTAILKPSPYTPLEAFVLAAAAQEAGIPPGVLNVITGGRDVGLALTTDARVDMVSFTGSDAVGTSVNQQAAGTLKKVLLELGGKSALIVRRDADLVAAAQFAVGQYTLQAGQGCSLCTRHLVHHAVKDEFLELMVAFTRDLRLGDPAEPGTTMGPLIRDPQRGRVEQYVDSARHDGARIVIGGNRPPALTRRLFLRADHHHRCGS